MTIAAPYRLSHTAIQTYLECPAKYRAKHIDKRTEPPAPPFVVGIAYHAALEWLCLQTANLRRLGQDTPLARARLVDNGRQKYLDAFEEGTAKAGWIPSKVKRFRDEGLGACEALMVASFAFDVVETEVRFSIPIRPGVVLTGSIDATERRQFPIDWKGAAKTRQEQPSALMGSYGRPVPTKGPQPWTLDKARHEGQPGIYGLAQLVRTGTLPRFFVFVVAEKHRESQMAKVLPVGMSWMRVISAYRLAYQTSIGIEAGYFPRAASCQWCPFRTAPGDQQC
jgi:hypothetical protein